MLPASPAGGLAEWREAARRTWVSGNFHDNLTGTAQDATLDVMDHQGLPFFHSFGYTMFWFAANTGMGMVCHPSPLDAAVIGSLVQRFRGTVLLATPTFLQLYLRRCTPAQ